MEPLIKKFLTEVTLGLCLHVIFSSDDENHHVPEAVYEPAPARHFESMLGTTNSTAESTMVTVLSHD
ncbi:MAG TPA: hypothetical protein VMR25_17310 [Planctomycetaceae bacterium]|jgi:hypothetical protein|nr:hypothetical protein [Planctomycetaceae bacterium]